MTMHFKRLTTRLQNDSATLALNTIGVMALATLLALPIAVRAQAVACVAGQETAQTFSFPAAAWAAGTTGPYTFNVGAGATAVALTFNITNVAGQPFLAPAPDQLTLGNVVNSVRVQHSGAAANTYLSTQNLAFSRPVNKLSWVALDVDSGAGTFQDQIVTRVNGNVIPTAMTSTGGATFHTIVAATGTATAVAGGPGCGNAVTSCNVTSGFNTTGITSARQDFLTGPLQVAATQYTGWNSFSWCLPALTNITLRKTWVNATLNNAVTIAATGLTSLASVANTANETDTTAVQTVGRGSVLNLSETFTTGTAADYTTTLACTGTTGLVGSTLTVGQTDTSIVCTYTNTKKIILAVTKSVSQTPLIVGLAGQFYTINVAVTNGPTTAAITLADVLPTGITTSGAITATGGTLSGCPAAGASSLAGCSIAPGAAGPIVITVPIAVASTATTGTNTVTATGGGDLLCTGIAPACTATTPITAVSSNASLLITKTDAKAFSSSGMNNTYVLTLSNQGPSPANGAIVTDTPTAGLTCPATNALACTVTGGAAVCPTGPLTFANLSAGLTLGSFPANSALQFTYVCNVN
jgi:trimeric autotransporter adhesin